MIRQPQQWPTTNQMGRLQIELSNYCNAKCPECERAYRPEELNNTNLTLEEIKKTFIPGQWDSCDTIHFCGNVDEPTINPEIYEITKYFHMLPKNKATVQISTNGGTRDEKFWREMGELSLSWPGDIGDRQHLEVIFAIDGLKDTNHMYRIGVHWDRLVNNYKAYIKAGGNATWQFIVFPWNKHQIQEAEKLAYNEGFTQFLVTENYRVNDRSQFNYESRYYDTMWSLPFEI